MSEQNSIPQNEIPQSSPNLSGILDIIGKLNLNQAPPTDSPPPKTEAPTADGSMLSGILSNPELMSKLPELISIISPLMSSLSAGAAPTGAIKTDSPKASHELSYPQNRDFQNRSALLCALKPYLRKERQDAIDYMIKLSRLGDVLKTL